MGVSLQQPKLEYEIFKRTAKKTVSLSKTVCRELTEQYDDSVMGHFVEVKIHKHDNQVSKRCDD